ncbi:O-antigen ligase family protein [Kiloniella antarctica]|uniref:O-antigen ligase family protein n=1 Tax=Kiloniella antarctica TaxID=1550907 RepID=A0ABW5BN18_9PROT
MNSHLLRLFFFAVPTISVFSSNALVPVVAFVGVATAVITYFKDKKMPKFSKLQLGLLVAVFGWITISTFWTINPLNALKLDLRLFALTLCGLLLISSVESQSVHTHRALAKALLIGCVLAALFLLVESTLSAPITKLIKGKSLDYGMNLSRFNRGATFLGITAWALFSIYGTRLSLFLKLLLPVVPLVVLFFAPSESTLFAVLLGSIWYLLFFAMPRFGFKLLPVLLVASVLVMPLVAKFAAPLHGPESSQSIPFSAKHRFFIWEFVGTQIFENPIVGWGFDAARDYPNKGVENYVHVDGNDKERALGGRIISLHPHNFSLQVWLELGGIGAVLVSLIIWNLFGYLKRNGLGEDAAIQAMVVSTFIIALLGYGIWQNRWYVMFFVFASMVPLVRSCTQVDKRNK